MDYIVTLTEEPVTKSTDEVIVCTTNVCAVNVPVVVSEPVMRSEPDTVGLYKSIYCVF
jgi:hypothetical protein